MASITVIPCNLDIEALIKNRFVKFVVLIIMHIAIALKRSIVCNNFGICVLHISTITRSIKNIVKMLPMYEIRFPDIAPSTETA